jgi:hypothetical protein
VRPHLVRNPEGPIDIYQYPRGYGYVASEWSVSCTNRCVVLLESHH